MCKQAVGYVRVSTTSQAIEGISLDNQIAKIEAYCGLNDLELVSIVKDEGLSAKNLTGRPNAQAMFEQAVKNKYCIVVYKLDRMFRNTVDALTTISQMDKKGVVFHSINEKLDTSSAMGKFFITMLAALAELERNVVSERTRDAMQNKKSQGFRVGNIAFGWSLGGDGKVLVKNDSEQQILGFIKRLRKKGLSLQKVANVLNDQGHTTRTGNQFSKYHVRNLAKIL